MTMTKIMLDAGHYGDYNRSPGFPAYWESHMTWKLCNLLAGELAKYGITVGRTRDVQKEDLELYYRGAKAKGYDMFISLHSNAVGSSVNEDIDHPVVYRLTSDADEGERLALELSQTVARLMGTKQEGRTAIRLQSNGSEYYGVLRGAKAAGCPHAFIIEHSFHTATAPAKWLYDEKNLALLAKAEAKVIAGFFGIKGDDESMSDADKKRIEALEAKVKNLENSKEKVYHYYSELPDWARETVTKLHMKGVFAGGGPGDMNLPETLMRMLVILVSNGVLKV